MTEGISVVAAARYPFAPYSVGRLKLRLGLLRFLDIARQELRKLQKLLLSE